MTFAIETPAVFELGFLARLQDFHRALELEVPHVDEVWSLVNARSTRGNGEQLIVEELLARPPTDDAELAALQARVISNPLYRNTLISEDARLAVVSVQLDAFVSNPGEADPDVFSAAFDDVAALQETEGAGEPGRLTEPQLAAAVRRAREVVARFDAPGFRISLTGMPVVSERLNTLMQSDIGRFLGLSVVAISALLYLLFRRVGAVALPLLVVVLAMLCTMGTMALSGTPMSIATQILPSFLLAVGVCDAVHMLAIFYPHVSATGDREQAVARALAHAGLPIVMTSLTTAAGLAAFVTAEFAPVATLGMFAPIGVLYALFYSVVLLPALLTLLPAKVRRSAPTRNRNLSRAVAHVGGWAASRPWTVVVASGLILGISAAGATRLHFSHDSLAWFPEGDAIRTATELVNRRLGGATVLELLVDSGENEGLYGPSRLRELEEIHLRLALLQREGLTITKTTSLVDIVKEIHQALNEERPDFYAIPDSRQLVSQELLLFESAGSDDLEDVVDPAFRTARVTLRVPLVDAVAYPPLSRDVETEVARIVGAEVAVRVTGMIALLGRTFTAMIESMTRSYVAAFLVITPLMILLIGRWWLGLLSMVPNLTPVVVVLGYMGWAGIPIDGSNLMIGSIIIGVAVDDTIHFMHRFRREFDRCGDARLAVELTLETTGLALLFTSLVLAAGFFTFAGAYMGNMFHFGVLSGAAILIAFAANIAIAPALAALLSRSNR
jgi:predicted RND superfamily exporter protein